MDLSDSKYSVRGERVKKFIWRNGIVELKCYERSHISFGSLELWNFWLDVGTNPNLIFKTLKLTANFWLRQSRDWNEYKIVRAVSFFINHFLTEFCYSIYRSDVIYSSFVLETSNECQRSKIRFLIEIIVCEDSITVDNINCEYAGWWGVDGRTRYRIILKNWWRWLKILLYRYKIF